MIENRVNYIFNAEENAVVKNFAVLKDGKQIASGFVGISDDELLQIYESDSELAEKDPRLSALLKGEDITEETEKTPSQLDRIEKKLDVLTADTVTAESIDTAITEGVNEV